MNIEIVLQGTTPLLMHNPRMVDPNFELNRKIKEITSKRRKTDEDHQEIERLEWYGGMYTGLVDGREVVTQPTSKARKCFIEAARINKQGKGVERALVMADLDVPLLYDGSESADGIQGELDRIFADRSYHSRLSVGVGGKRVMRVRPQFRPWAMVLRAVFLPDAGLNMEEFRSIVALAGKAVGIGDNRINGYGRFLGHVRDVNGNGKPLAANLAAIRHFVERAES